jgi:hypothetical protein
MSQLEFEFQDVLNELDAFARIAEKYLRPESRQVLPQLAAELEGIRNTPTNVTHVWGIRNERPLRTTVSVGEYQPDGEGEHNVYAEITSQWEIERIKPPGKKNQPGQRFRLVGIASTRIRLLKEVNANQPSEELAMWRMEIGDSYSPGCHFHIQVLGESTDGPFPHSLDVPRLPGLISTPAATVEYVLAELFQDDWQQHLATKSADVNRWAPIQRQRLSSVLGWHLSRVQEANGSPWPALKASRPPTHLFVAEKGWPPKVVAPPVGA